jgi:hypothetical protein
MMSAAAELAGLAGRVGLDARTLGEVLARAGSPDYAVWEQQVRRTGGCSHPIRLAGTISRNGSTVLDTATLPDRVLLKRCGNRREAVCPSCSYEYRGDAWQLLRAGTTGGHKGMPALAGHLEEFITLTAPSFGPVHGRRDNNRPCHPTDEGQLCRHGKRRWCMTRHGDADDRLGQPLCPDCYDYRGHVLFNWWASAELWRRFTVYVRRTLASRLGYTQKRLAELVRIEFGKVAEFQRRGVIHYHALVRIDGYTPDGSYRPAPIRIDHADVRAAIITAAGQVSYTTLEAPGRVVTLRFGRQVDVQQVNSGITGEITPEAVAAYISKYQTKGSEDFGLAGRPVHPAAARAMGLSDHVCRIISAATDLARTPGLELERLERWTHMLGFRGHAFTKSRRFSTTFTALRRARSDHQRQADRDARDTGDDHHDDDTDLVVNLRYVGKDYLTSGDALLASSIAAWTREGRQLAQEDAA